MINRIVQHKICQPETHKRDSSLHQDAFQNVLVNMMAQFVR
jgi:hypothetical protein